MRSDNVTLQEKIYNENGYHLEARVSIYNNRIYAGSTDFSATVNPAYRKDAGIDDIPVPESLGVASDGKVITVVCVDGSAMQILKEGSATIVDLSFEETPLECAYWSRPTLVGSSLFYVDANDLSLKRAVLNLTDLTVSSLETIASAQTYRGSLYGVSSTEAVYLHIQDGGIGITQFVYSSGWTSSTWGYRFMWPLEIWSDSTSIDSGKKLYWLNFAGVVRNPSNNNLYVYISHPDGSVVGVKKNANGIWGDVFTALPQDLTHFRIANVFIDSNNRTHMVGQFVREKGGESVSYITGEAIMVSEGFYSIIYNMDLWSDDGLTFSIDRFVLLSTDGHRFQMMSQSNRNVLSCTGLMKALGTYWSTHKTNSSVSQITDINSISLSVDGDLRISFPIQGKDWWKDPYAKKGNVVIVEVGVRDESDTNQYIVICTGILSSKRIKKTSSGKSFEITVTPDSLWKTSNMIYPFYLEIQSKQSCFLNTKDTLVMMSEAQNSKHAIGYPFSVDMWQESGSNKPADHVANTTTAVKSVDLNSILSGYPAIESGSFPFTVNIYGWSRSGLPTTNPNSPSTGPVHDATSSTGLNDTFQPFFIVKGPLATDEERTVTIPLIRSTTPYPPQYWKTGTDHAPGGSAPGDFPVTYTVQSGDGLNAGDKIYRIGVNVISQGVPTVYYIERVDIPELLMYYSNLNSGWKHTTHKPVDITDSQTQTGSVGATIAGGTTISGLVVGAKYSIESSGGPWHAYGGDGDRYTFSVAHNSGWEDAGGYTTGTGLVLHTPSWADSCEAVDSLHTRVIFTATVETISFRCSDATIWWDNTGGLGYTVKLITVPNPDQTPDENGDISVLSMADKGVPSVSFSNTPANPFNFQISARCQISGTSSWFGVVGLGKDYLNLVGLRASSSKIQIFKSRGGTITVLAEENNTFGDKFDIMLRHKDGKLFGYIRSMVPGIWPSTPQISYTWTYADGPMAMSDLCRVGIYGFIDTPSIRVLPYSSSQSSYLGITPGTDLTAFAEFPSSGSLSINGNTFTYTGKVSISNAVPRGPFAFCNSGEWTQSSGGANYSGKSVDICWFQWMDNSSHKNDASGYLLVTDGYISNLISQTDWQPWITTLGEQTWILNRSRHYLDHKGITSGSKAWVTVGFSGVKCDTAQVVSYNDQAFLQEGDGEIIVYSFSGHAGERDLTIADLLDRITRLAGGSTEFPGDMISTNVTLSTARIKV